MRRSGRVNKYQGLLTAGTDKDSLRLGLVSGEAMAGGEADSVAPGGALGSSTRLLLTAMGSARAGRKVVASTLQN